jgi:hypothetical protein
MTRSPTERTGTCVGVAAVLGAVAPMKETGSSVRMNGQALLSESVGCQMRVSGSYTAVATRSGQLACPFLVRRRSLR